VEVRKEKREKVEGVKAIVISALLLFCCNKASDVYDYKIECRFMERGYTMTNNSRSLYYGFDGARKYYMLNFERVEMLYPKDPKKQPMMVNRK